MATLLTKRSDHTTNNYKKALVVSLNEYVEEDVTLLIEGTTVNCFVSFCPYEIEIGKTYEVELAINLSDNYEIQEAEVCDLLVEKIDSGYSYFLYGTLHNSTLQTFTTLNDEDLHYDYPELNDHFIKLEVERIDVSFR